MKIARGGVFLSLLLVLCAFAAGGLLLYDWFVDDAAISFTYARNIASGHGIVAFPGAERVEGYSNPLWVFLLAVFQLVGIGPFSAAKLLGLLFGGATIVSLYRIGAQLCGRAGATLASALLALHAPFVIWSFSGLETSLMCWLLVLGVERILAAPAGMGVPVILFLLALTRPEGILYGVVALSWLVAYGSENRRRSFATLGIFVLLLGAYHAWHYLYFAAPVTNSFYAKKVEIDLFDRLFDLSTRGWQHLGAWASRYGLLWFAPFVPLSAALAPDRRTRIRWSLILLLLLGAWFFQLYSNSDWMKEFRFIVPASPFLFLAMAGGLRSLTHRLGSHPLMFPALAVLLCVFLSYRSIPSYLAYRDDPDVSVADVKVRAEYFRGLAKKLRLERQATLLDPDLGGTSYFSGMRVADTEGLSNVAFAIHKHKETFTADYVFGELRPDFAHVFTYWQNQTHILQDPRWGQRFVLLPAYRTRKGDLDGGNWVSRDLLRASPEDFPSDSPVRSDLGGGLLLTHAVLDNTTVEPGGNTDLHLYWQLSGTIPASRDTWIDARFERQGAPSLDLGHVPIYGWLPPNQWRPGETLKETLEVHVPTSQPEGEYVLTIAVRGATDPSDASDAVRLLVRRGSTEEEAKRLSADAQAALDSSQWREATRLSELAQALQPENADARRLVEESNDGWRDQALSAVKSLMWSRRLSESAEAFRWVRQRWPEDPRSRQVGQELGQLALRSARQLERARELGAAFRHYVAAVEFDPRLSQARRRAEALRLKRDPARPMAETDSQWITAMELGVGKGPQMSEPTTDFVAGETISSRVHWNKLEGHHAEWVWYSPNGERLFANGHAVQAGNSLSYSIVTLPHVTGTWLVEVFANGESAAVRRFQVRRAR